MVLQKGLKANILLVPHMCTLIRRVPQKIQHKEWRWKNKQTNKPWQYKHHQTSSTLWKNPPKSSLYNCCLPARDLDYSKWCVLGVAVETARNIGKQLGERYDCSQPRDRIITILSLLRWGLHVSTAQFRTAMPRHWSNAALSWTHAVKNTSAHDASAQENEERKQTTIIDRTQCKAVRHQRAGPIKYPRHWSQ